MVLNEEQWIKELREKRIAYGISQGRLAVASGITREYLNKIESGKMKPSKELLETLYKELARFNPEAPLATVYKGNIIKNLIMDCQSYTKYRPNETTGGIFVSWRRKEELPTGA